MAEAGARRTGTGPLWTAPAALALLALASHQLYETAPRALAEVAFVPYAAALVFGPAIVYPTLRSRGARVRLAVAGSLLVPFLWLAKECHRVWTVFGLGSALYYALNPLAVGLLVACTLQMAVAELALRRRREGRLRLGGGPAVALGAVALFGAGVGGAAWRWGPDTIFYAYVALYRYLFGG